MYCTYRQDRSSGHLASPVHPSIRQGETGGAVVGSLFGAAPWRFPNRRLLSSNIPVTPGVRKATLHHQQVCSTARPLPFDRRRRPASSNITSSSLPVSGSSERGIVEAT